MPIVGPNTVSIYDAAVAANRETAQPVLDAASKVNQFAARMDEVEGIAAAVDTRVDDLVNAVERVDTQFADIRKFGATTVANNNASAVYAAIASLGSRGGRIFIPSGKYRFTETLVFTTPVVIEGATGGYGAASAVLGAELAFAPGVSGVKIDAGNNLCRISNLAITSESTVAGTDDGLTILGGRWIAESLFIFGFGRDGVSITGGAGVGGQGGNSNVGQARVIRSIQNKRNGYMVGGGDANVCGFYNCDAMQNGGYGFENFGAKNGFYSCHSNANTLGDVLDRGAASFWANFYSEGEGKFIADNRGYGGVFIGGGTYAVPQIWSGAAGAYVQDPTAAYTRGWTFDLDGGRLRQWRLRSNDGTKNWQFTTDVPSAGWLEIRDTKVNKPILRFNGENPTGATWDMGFRMGEGTNIQVGTVTGTQFGTSASEKISFHGATPTARPTVTGSRGGNAALASLLAALAAKGLITDSTTA